MHLAVLVLLLQQHPANPANFPIAKVEITPSAAEVAVGGKGQLAARAIDAGGQPLPGAAIEWVVARGTADGRLHALAPGRATIPAKAGPAATPVAVQVVANTVARVVIDPAASALRTGDVVRFAVTARDQAGRPIADVPAEWAVAATGGAGVAQIDAAGAFVAETPRGDTVTATIGGEERRPPGPRRAAP